MVSVFSSSEKGRSSVRLSTPTPSLPAIVSDSSLPAAIHMRGCGFCSIRGTIVIGAIWKYSPSYWKLSCVQICGIRCRTSSSTGRVSSPSMWKIAHSRGVDRPNPISRRPPLRLSSTAARSARRTGWLKSGCVSTTEWPTRSFFVRIATAVRNCSGAGMCVTSTEPWCSTDQNTSKPASSATSACSRMSMNSWRSAPCGIGYPAP